MFTDVFLIWCFKILNIFSHSRPEKEKDFLKTKSGSNAFIVFIVYIVVVVVHEQTSGWVLWFRLIAAELNEMTAAEEHDVFSWSRGTIVVISTGLFSSISRRNDTEYQTDVPLRGL